MVTEEDIWKFFGLSYNLGDCFFKERGQPQRCTAGAEEQQQKDNISCVQSRILKSNYKLHDYGNLKGKVGEVGKGLELY